MRRLLMLTVAILATLTVYAKNEKKVKSKISSVTVYREGAQITRTANVTVGKGKTTLVFDDLTHKVNADNIQVKASKGLTILSVTKSIDYLTGKIIDANTKKLEERRIELSDSMVLINGTIDICDDEKDMIYANRSIGGENGVSIEELKRAALFYRTRLTEIETKKYKLNIVKGRIKRDLDKIENHLEQNDTPIDKPVGVVKVVVSADRPVSKKIELRYIVADASWKPDYSIRVNEVSKPVDLYYNAKVKQKTGEDWNNVKLVLSTGNPYASNTKPELDPYNLDFSNHSDRSYSKQSDKYTDKTQTSVEFRIDQRYTITTDDAVRDVSMVKYKIPTSYRYSAVPKLSSSVFLMARIADYTDFNLLSGNAKLFLKDTYQGNTYLDMFTTNDTLSVSLGHDRDIIIKRESIKEYTSKSFAGSYKKDQRAWEITIKSNKKVPVEIDLTDQYPVSRTSDIKVDLTEDGGAVVNKDTGELKWKIKLKPREKKTVVFKYIVKYPKYSNVVVR